jgi:YNFM family putative membrane transporter
MGGMIRLGAAAAFLAGLRLVALAQFAVWIPLGASMASSFPQAAGGGLASIGSTFGLAFAAGSLVVGPPTDRFGRWPVLVWALIGLSVTTLAAGLAPTWSSLLAARVAQGLTAAAIPVAASLWASDALSPRGFALVTAVFTASANQVAAIGGQIYGQLLVDVGGWRLVYTTLGGGYALAAIICATRLGGARATAADASIGGVLRRALGLFGYPRLVGYWLIAGVLLGALLAMYAGMEVAGFDQGFLLRVRLAGLVGAVTAVGLLAVLHHTHPGWLALAGLVATTAGLLAQTASTQRLVVVAGSVLVAGATTLALPPLVVMIVAFAGTAKASALAVYGGSVSVGATLGGVLPGLLPGWVGYSELCGLIAAAAAAAAFVMTVSGVEAGRHERRGVHPQPWRTPPATRPAERSRGEGGEVGES